jgi:hypothetical protein
MIITELHQTPTDKLDYTIDFTSWLNLVSDVINTVAWTVPPGITQSDLSNTSYTATCYLTGGTRGQRYPIDCKITTNAATPRIKTASIAVTIEAD